MWCCKNSMLIMLFAKVVLRTFSAFMNINELNNFQLLLLMRLAEYRNLACLAFVITIAIWEVETFKYQVQVVRTSHIWTITHSITHSHNQKSKKLVLQLQHLSSDFERWTSLMEMVMSDKWRRAAPQLWNWRWFEWFRFTFICNLHGLCCAELWINLSSICLQIQDQ